MGVPDWTQRGTDMNLTTVKKRLDKLEQGAGCTASPMFLHFAGEEPPDTTCALCGERHGLVVRIEGQLRGAGKVSGRDHESHNAPVMR